jgi:hypothetical protein
VLLPIFNKNFQEFVLSCFSVFLAFLFSAKMATYFSRYRSSQEQKKVIEMETKMKERLKGNGQFGMLRKVEALYQRVTKKLSVKASEVATTSSTPYEISKVYKTHTMAVELRRSQALTAAQRQNLRGR